MRCPIAALIVLVCCLGPAACGYAEPAGSGSGGAAVLLAPHPQSAQPKVISAPAATPQPQADAPLAVEPTDDVEVEAPAAIREVPSDTRKPTSATRPEPARISPKPASRAAESAAREPEPTRTLDFRVAAPTEGRRQDRIALFRTQARQRRAPAKQELSLPKAALGMFLKLAAVLALAYFSIRALKMLSAGRMCSPRIGPDLKVVNTVRLSSASSLHVVDFKGKTMLVGCSSGQVNLLREFEGVVEPDTGVAQDGRFAAYLEKYSGESGQNTAAKRVAGVLRDCAVYLQSRRGAPSSGEKATGVKLDG